MKILGFDPGLAIVGYGVLETNGHHHTPLACGVIQTKANTPLPERLLQVYEGAKELIETYQPDAVAIEELFFNTNTTTAFSVAQARGVLVLSAVREGIALYEYTPLQVKQAVAGYGRADKMQMQQMVKMLLKLKEVPKPDDAADAMAVALCHAHAASFHQKMGTGKV